MFKNRKKTIKSKTKDYSDFVNGSDTNPNSLKKNASRNFKAITLKMNEHEYLELEELSKTTGRSKLNLIRYAIAKLSESSKD